MDHGEGPDQEKIRLIARVRLDGEDLRVMVHLALLRFFPPYDFGTECSSHYKTLGPHVPASESQAKFLIPLEYYCFFAEDDGLCSGKNNS